jgi:hypothetical protein
VVTRKPYAWMSGALAQVRLPLSVALIARRSVKAAAYLFTPRTHSTPKKPYNADGQTSPFRELLTDPSRSSNTSVATIVKLTTNHSEVACLRPRQNRHQRCEHK